VRGIENVLCECVCACTYVCVYAWVFVRVSICVCVYGERRYHEIDICIYRESERRRGCEHSAATCTKEEKDIFQNDITMYEGERYREK